MMSLYFICNSLNDVTSDEYFELIGSLKYIFDKQFQCYEHHLPKWMAIPEHFFDEFFKKHQSVNFCKKVSDKNITENHKYNGLDFRTCPCNYFNPEIYSIIELANQFKSSPYNELIMVDGKVSNKLHTIIKITKGFIAENEHKEQEKSLEKVTKKKGK